MNVRFSIKVMALLIKMLCYTDRVCLVRAGSDARKAFGLDQAQMGLVYSIFSLSYFLGQTPWGMLADRQGSRGLISFAVAGWSAFSAITVLVLPPSLMGWVLKQSNDWDSVLMLSVGTTSVAAFLWLFVNPRAAKAGHAA